MLLAFVCMVSGNGAQLMGGNDLEVRKVGYIMTWRMAGGCRFIRRFGSPIVCHGGPVRGLFDVDWGWMRGL